MKCALRFSSDRPWAMDHGLYTMKTILVFCAALSFCTISFGQNANSAEIASAETPKKQPSSKGARLYLLSNGDKTSEISVAEFKKLKKTDIEYVRVLKDPVLLSMYGDKAKSGVILVQLKNSTDEKKRKQRKDSLRDTKEPSKSSRGKVGS
jgi:hypothetical protein